MSTTFYTTPAHERAIVTSATSNTSTMKNVLSQNMNQTWEPTSADLPVWKIAIDTYPQDEATYQAGRGFASGSIDAVGIWFANTNTDFSSSVIGITNSLQTSGGTIVGNYAALSDINGPMYVKTLDLTGNDRYYFIEGTTFTDVPQIGGIFLCKTNTITRQHEYRGSEKLPLYDNTLVKLTGLGEHISLHQRNPIYTYKRAYKLISSSEVSWVDNVFNQSSGRRNLFIYTEGTTQADNNLCRFSKDKPKWKDITQDYREATLEFKTIPYVSDGDTL